MSYGYRGGGSMRPFLIGAAGGATLGGGAVYAYIQRRGDESPASSKPIAT